MGKRQIRIFQNQIMATSHTIVNKEVNVVLKNGKTLTATLIQIKENQLQLKDHFLQKHNVRLEEIEEIVLDFIAPY